MHRLVNFGEFINYILGKSGLAARNIEDSIDERGKFVTRWNAVETDAVIFISHYDDSRYLFLSGVRPNIDGCKPIANVGVCRNTLSANAVSTDLLEDRYDAHHAGH
jgi:hypothetical protein